MGAMSARGAHGCGPGLMMCRIAASGFEENTHVLGSWRKRIPSIDENNGVRLGRDLPTVVERKLKGSSVQVGLGCWCSCIEKIFGRKGFSEDALLVSSGVEILGIMTHCRFLPY